MKSQPEIAYLNTASCGLLSLQSLEKTHAFYEAMQTRASGRSEYWRFNELPQIRETLAEFMDAPVQNVAFIPNFTFGLTSIVHSLHGTERVLLYKNDFPSVLEPFKVNNFDITWIDDDGGFDIAVDHVKQVLTEQKIDVFVISHVQYASGFKIDIHELASFCRQQDIVFIVDATQSLGGVELSARKLGADAIISSNYKWMNAGFGTGVMYVADSFLSRYTPKVAGFNSYTMEGNRFYYEPSVRSFEPGHLNIPGLLLLEAAMKEKLTKGLQVIEKHNRGLTISLLESITKFPVKLLGTADVSNRSSIVLIKDENDLGAFLEEQGVIVTRRGGFLRLSMHFYNTEADVSRFISCLEAFRWPMYT